MGFGSIDPKTFVNGSVSEPVDANNLNDMERVLELTDEELAFSNDIRFRDLKEKMFDENCKTIEGFEDDTSWTAMASTTVSANNDCLCGKQGTNIVENDNVASWIGMYKTISSIDLTLFNGGAASSTDDFIAFWFYISDPDAFNLLQIKLGDDNSNNYQYTIYPAGNLDSGWKCIYCKKSDFTVNGSPTGWDDITYLRIEALTFDNYINEYVLCEMLMLYRQDSSISTQFNPFQTNDGTNYSNVFDIDTYMHGLFYDEWKREVCCAKIDYTNVVSNEATLLLKDNIIQFAAKFEITSRYHGYGTSITWFRNTSNNFEARVRNDYFELGITENGSNSTLSYGFDNALKYNEMYQVVFEKTATTVMAIFLKDGESIKTLEHTIVYNQEEEGGLYLGNYSNNGLSIISDFQIGSKRNYFDTYDTTKVIIKEEDESTQLDTSPNTDAELYCYLPPNTIFEIDLNLAVASTSATPDFRILINSSGVNVFNDGRFFQSTSSAVTTYTDAPFYVGNVWFSTELHIGLATSYELYHFERILCCTGNNGGYIAVQWAQWTSDAAATVVKAGSYMKITKCKK